MKTRFRLSVIAVSAVMFLVACGPQATQALATPTPTASGTVEDQAGLIEALKAAGAEVETGEQVEQPFFAVKGQVLKVNGEDVQVYEYESDEAMEADARQVSADGSTIGTTMATWVAPPHFFKSGRILVLYVGEDSTVLGLLKEALGEQFAGR